MRLNHSRSDRGRAGLRAALATSCLVAAAAATACSGPARTAGGPTTPTRPSFAAGTTMARLSAQGTVRVGVKFDQPGFGLVGIDQVPSGFDVEIAKLIAAELGIPADKISWIEAPSRLRETLVERGGVDYVVATYTVTEKRREKVTFAGPYYIAGQDLMVRTDDNVITGPAWFRANPGARVCSVTGSTPAETIRSFLASPAQLVLYDVYSKCATALGKGEVRAVTTDNVILLGIAAASDGRFRLVGNAFTEEPYGIAVRRGDPAFCGFINAVLVKAQTSGSYERAWNDTAGRIRGAQTPDLPEQGNCT